MIRLCVAMSLVVMISSFSVNMCDVPPVGRQAVAGVAGSERRVVPIICEPRLRKRDVCSLATGKLVYEATFEDDRIIIRPQRRRRKTFLQRVLRQTRRWWGMLRELWNLK